jgi:uncharacterized LabA/DUF88 family protein
MARGPLKRVTAYIDGFNLYFGLRSKGWKHFYWLNLQKVAQHLLKPDQTLVTTKYFTTIVTSPSDKQRRQATFLEALGTLSNFYIYYGHFLTNKITCRNCGYTYMTHHEKMTDVNLSLELLADAFQDAFDVALLISADSDLVGPVQKVKQLFPQKRTVIVFPPGRHSNALQKVGDACLHLDRLTLARSVFPDVVVKPDGFALQRPPQWR